MPNWATGSMTLVLPTKNVDKFLSFIERNEDKHFYRTTFTENEAPANNSHGLTKLSFNVECAWSAENCLVNPDADAEDCIPLEELCKQLKVQRLSARFEEHGLMFGETLYYDKEDGLSYDSFELETEADIDFDDYEEYIDDEERKRLNCDGDEFGENADHSPYYANGIIAIDACTAHSGQVNCLVIDD